SISQDLYRIQIEGYIEEDREDAAKNLVLFFDEERQRSVRARVGDERVESEFKLVDFNVERVSGPDGSIRRVAKATILDQRTGEEVDLTRGERRYEDTVTVVIRSDEDPAVEVVLNEAGATFETPS